MENLHSTNEIIAAMIVMSPLLITAFYAVISEGISTWKRVRS